MNLFEMLKSYSYSKGPGNLSNTFFTPKGAEYRD